MIDKLFLAPVDDKTGVHSRSRVGDIESRLIDPLSPTHPKIGVTRKLNLYSYLVNCELAVLSNCSEYITSVNIFHHAQRTTKQYEKLKFLPLSRRKGKK